MIDIIYQPDIPGDSVEIKFDSCREVKDEAEVVSGY